jgi:PAS domain S-box-containing protein
MKGSEKTPEQPADDRASRVEMTGTEEALAKTRMQCRLLRRCNEIFVRASEESGLAEEACRAIIEEFDQRFAWVGFAERDETKTVQPMGLWGREEGYLDATNPLWADNEQGRSPTGTAIRTGRHFLVRNMRTASADAVWRTEAIKRGYASCLALPLRGEGGVFGALTVYSGEFYAFGADEVDFLTHVAEILAHWLVTIRLRNLSRSAEGALKENEARYRSLFHYMRDGVAIYRARGNGEDFEFVDVNRAVEKIERTRREDLIGKSVLQAFPGVREFGLFDVLKRVWKTGKPERLPAKRYSDERVQGWRENVVYKLPSGEIVAVYSDETKRKGAEDALRSSEERFRAIFEAARDCLYIKDRDLRYVLVNPAMEELFGLPGDRIVGRTAEDLFGEDGAKDITETDLRVLNGQTIEDEHRRSVNGVLMTFHDTRVPLRDAEGEIIGIGGISRNVTDRRRALRPPVVSVTDYPSEAMRAALDQARHAAATDGIVLLLGESGCGKDFLARWIHDHSRRANGPFFTINCAAVAPELAESELFGHEPGAFTGARGRKRGLLELAEGGTLLLNEVGELPMALQSKLLAFLDRRSFLRVGGENSIQVNARLIAATHRALEEEVEQGRFLDALFYRLNVFTIKVPALRERAEDIPLLVEEIVSELAAEMQLAEVPMTHPAALDRLSDYHWPGNVRELRNALERSLMLFDEGLLNVAVPSDREGDREWSLKVDFPATRSLHDVTDDVTRSLCTEALRRCGGRKRMAAKLLGISRDSLYRYLKRVT